MQLHWSLDPGPASEQRIPELRGVGSVVPTRPVGFGLSGLLGATTGPATFVWQSTAQHPTAPHHETC